MRYPRLLAIALTLPVLLSPTASHAWVVQPEHGYGHGIVRAANGDLVTCGAAWGSDRYDFSVRRQRPADGSDVWLYQLDGSDSGFPGSGDTASAVALDGAGDIIAAGSTNNVGTSSDVQLVKLDPNGSPRWTRRLDSDTHQEDSFAAMAVDADGDVVATGTFGISEAVTHRFSIVKVAGATGEPLWRHDVIAPHSPSARTSTDCPTARGRTARTATRS